MPLLYFAAVLTFRLGRPRLAVGGRVVRGVAGWLGGDLQGQYDRRVTMPTDGLPTLYTALAEETAAGGGPSDPPDTIETRVIETTDESNLLDLLFPPSLRSGSILEVDEDGAYGDDDLYRNLGQRIRGGDDAPPPDTVYTATIETIDNDQGLTLLHQGY